MFWVLSDLGFKVKGHDLDPRSKVTTLTQGQGHDLDPKVKYPDFDLDPLTLRSRS